MSVNRSLLFLLLLCQPLAVFAGISADDLPEGALWYLHVDLKQIGNTDSGRGIYRWLDDEIFAEILDEVGLDIDKETDSITAISDATHGVVILIEGPMTSGAQQKMISFAGLQGELSEHKHKGKDYYFIQEEKSDDERRGSRGPLAGFEDGSYFSFAIKNKLLMSGSEHQMKELLANDGKVAGSESLDGAMFVLAGDQAFVQAGLNTGVLAKDDDDWNSNILRNTKQLALRMADQDGMIAIEAKLVSTEPKMAQSLGGIVSGLIGLQVFNSDLDSELKSLLSNIKVDVKENVLSISMLIEPDVLATVLDDHVGLGI